MGNVISEAEIKEGLEWLENREGLTGMDEELATKDLREGVKKEDIRKYIGKKVDDHTKTLCSNLLRSGAEPSSVDKYLDKKNKHKIDTAYNYSIQGIDIALIDQYFESERFADLYDIWKKSESYLKTKAAHSETVENDTTEIATPEVDEGPENQTSEGAGKDEKSDHETPKQESNVYYNGFTYEQVKDLVVMMTNNKSDNVASVQVSEERKAEVDFIKSMPAMISEIVSKAVEQTISHMNKESKETDSTIDELRKEINSLRKEAEERKNDHAESKNSSRVEKTIADDVGDKPENHSAVLNDKYENSTARNNLIYTASYGSGNNACSFPIEIEKRKTSGLGGLVSSLCFKKRYQRSLVSMAIAGQLDKNQLHHIATAIKSGLSENQLCDLIESRAPAERMPELIEIAVLEKRMGYAG